MMIDKDAPSPLELAANNSSMGEKLSTNTPESLLSWHVGSTRTDPGTLEDLVTTGAEVADLMPAVARSLEYHVMMLESLDDADGVHMDGCKVIAALLKRLTPEIELLASLPDALNTRA